MSTIFTKRLSRRGAVLFGLWVLLVLFHSARQSGPFVDSMNRTQLLLMTVCEWLPWLVMVPVIIWLDGLLPVPRDFIILRFLCHIPMAVVITLFCIYISWLITNICVHLISAQLPLHFSVVLLFTRSRFHANFQFYWVLLIAYIAYRYSHLLRETELQTAKLNRMFCESRLAALRSQMHPHFLFNALNTISAYVETNPRSARHLLEQLGDLLRFSLEYAEDQIIPLAEELKFIDRYLALQKARFEERLEIIISVDTEISDVPVPTFLLEPLVENAIRYGIAPCTRKGIVEIRAKREKGRLYLSVRDDGQALPPDWDSERCVGLGIRNTRERLCFLYGPQGFEFNIANEEGGGVLVELLLPIGDTITALSTRRFSHA